MTIATGTLASVVELTPSTWVLLVDTWGHRGNSGGPVLNGEVAVIGFMESVGLVDEFGYADPFTYVVDITGQSFLQVEALALLGFGSTCMVFVGRKEHPLNLTQ